MGDTKKNILEGSLALFNDYGLTNVSQRRISDALGISPGNLTYHFRKKEDIYESLYFAFVERIEKEITLFRHSDTTLEAFYRLIEKWFSLLYQYRFIFLEITSLMRMSQKIANNYRQLVKTREILFLKIIHILNKAQIIRDEELPNEYTFLYDRLHVVSDYYLTAMRVMEESFNNTQQKNHSRLFFYTLYPYLTPKGKEEMGKLVVAP